MSCPRYVVEIKLYGTDCRYTWKMKTRVGDHKGFQKEMEVLAERGEFERISEGFVKHNGGLAKIEREWNRSYAELVGHDHHDVSAEDFGRNKMNTDDSEEGYIPWSCDACGAPCKKSLGPEGYCDTCRPIMLNGGNTPERVEEQIEWLKKKAAQKVIEQHSKAFEKLAEKENEQH